MMTSKIHLSWLLAATAFACVDLACGGDVPLGTKGGAGGGSGLGGTGTFASGTGGANADAGAGTGGAKGGTGGASVVDAPATGGSPGTGGTTTSPTGSGGFIMDGGAPGSGGAVGTGGKNGSGGATSTAGATGAGCGTIRGLTCPSGQFCDLASSCGAVSDAAGVCMPTGGGCTADWRPVCGCDGKTYSNDCTRISAGVLKARDGQCNGGTGGTGTGGTSAVRGTGGIIGDGGAVGSGGRTGSGGATGSGGSTTTCGGSLATRCASGFYCDLASGCGQIASASGMCRPTGGLCGDVYQPVCGCDGRTYPNDCTRGQSSVLKAADGACTGHDGGMTTYPTGYLAWELSGGVAGTGPAVVVSGAGWGDTWSTVAYFVPTSPPSNATSTSTLTSLQTDDLFTRVASVNLASLPHRVTTAAAECNVIFYFRACTTCTPLSVSYIVAADVAPEMDPVWWWFDQWLGASAATNPRNYCNF